MIDDEMSGKLQQERQKLVLQKDKLQDKRW